MPVVIRLVLAVAVALAASAPAYPSVQDELICWDPDVEFPVACEGGDE